MSERTAVYRLFGAEDALLYVGVAKNLGQRWRQHAASQPWWGDVQRQTVCWYPDRQAALAAEKAAIRDEKPCRNIVHTDRPQRGPAERLSSLESMEPAEVGTREHLLHSLSLSYHRAAVQQMKSTRTLADAIRQASDQGIRQVDIVRAVGLTRERVRQICDPVYRATRPAG